MISPLGRKNIDPFLLVRPVGKYLKSVARRSVAGCMKSLKRGTHSIWVAASRPAKPWWQRLPLYLLAALGAIMFVVLAIPADIILSGKK
jgi:hypothetical protein